MRQAENTVRSPWQPCNAAGWDQLQLKRRFDIELGKMLQNGPLNSSDTEVPYLKAQHVQWGEVRFADLPTMWASPNDIKSLRVHSGDLLVCEGGEVGRGAIVQTEPPDDCIIQNALHRVRGQAAGNQRFLYYLLRLAATQGWFDVLCNRSTIAHFTGDKFGEMWVWLPSVNQQRSIADFLDRETAKIDILVAAKERVLGILSEKRRALITHAVTHGLNPDTTFRKVGLPWVDEIPAHWDLRQLRFFCKSIQTGGTPSQNFMENPGDSVMNWFTPGDFGDSLLLSESTRKIPLEAVHAGEAKIFPPGTVFIVGIGATLGKVGYICEPSSANQQINALVPRPEALVEYLALLLSTLDILMKTLASSATLPILNQERTGDILVALPPIPEQRSIIAYVQCETAKLDSLRDATERTIKLSKERRAALIAAAVMGQIKVGEASSVSI